MGQRSYECRCKWHISKKVTVLKNNSVLFLFISLSSLSPSLSPYFTDFWQTVGIYLMWLDCLQTLQQSLKLPSSCILPSLGKQPSLGLFHPPTWEKTNRISVHIETRSPTSLITLKLFYSKYHAWATFIDGTILNCNQYLQYHQTITKKIRHSKKCLHATWLSPFENKIATIRCMG